MIIQSDNMQMHAKRSYRETRSAGSRSEVLGNSAKASGSSGAANFLESQSFSFLGANFGNAAEESTDSRPKTENADTLSEMVKSFQSTQGVKRSVMQERLRALDQIRQQTLNYLFDMLFGRNSSRAGTPMDVLSGTGTGMGGLTLQTTRYTSYFTYSENETTNFNAKGSVVTADGREIDFNIGLEMSRSFTQTAGSYIDFTQPVLCDPLVINLDSNISAVSDQKFFFDLDGDGTEEEISQLNSGSGFLALDQNGDGVINDGSELFGTTSGNGFADLAAYDQDGNGWIDEADAIFQRLKVWTKDENGKDRLMDLKEAGVGALYLGSADTEFSLKDAANNTNGVIRRTGMFLYEDGSSGTMQQLDLAT